MQFRPSPLNPNKQVHTKDPFVFLQAAFRWQSLIFFWHSSISKKKNWKEKKSSTTVVVKRVGYHIQFLNSYEVKKHHKNNEKLIVTLD